MNFFLKHSVEREICNQLESRKNSVRLSSVKSTKCYMCYVCYVVNQSINQSINLFAKSRLPVRQQSIDLAAVVVNGIVTHCEITRGIPYMRLPVIFTQRSCVCSSSLSAKSVPNKIYWTVSRIFKPIVFLFNFCLVTYGWVIWLLGSFWEHVKMYRVLFRG